MTPHPAPPPARRGLVLAALLSATLVVTVDASIVAVALPTLARDLRAPSSDVVWVTTAFLLATACCVPAAAALGDRVGRRRLFVLGLAVFTAASVACAAAPTLGALVAARAVQGAASAFVLAAPIPTYREVFPPERLGGVLGVNATAVALGTSAGPALGGLLLAVLPWPWLFLVTVPVGVVGAVLGWRVLPRTRAGGGGGGFDVAGALLLAAAIAAFLLGVRELSAPGTAAAVLLAATALLLAAFLRRERRAAAPVVPLPLFTRRFSLAVLTASCSFFAQGAAFVALPFLFQDAFGASALRSAALFTPWPLVVVLVAPLAGRAADRVSPALLATVGLAVLTGGLLALALLPDDPATADVVVRTAVCGLGFALFQSPNNRDMMAAAPMRHAGSAAGVLNLNRTVAQSAGSGAVSVVFVVAGAGLATAAEREHAVGVVLLVAAAGAGLGALLAATRVRASHS